MNSLSNHPLNLPADLSVNVSADVFRDVFATVGDNICTNTNICNNGFAGAIGCFTPEQIYQLEQQWFQTNNPFALMQQAAWQMTHWLITHVQKPKPIVWVVVGRGNNGGDGWAVASYLHQLRADWTVQVLEVAPPATQQAQQAKAQFIDRVDAAKTMLLTVQDVVNFGKKGLAPHIDLIIDAMFGIGLERQPTGDYPWVIDWINRYKQRFHGCQIISVDVPSGLNAKTGESYHQTTVHADITLCLLARKIGLHLYQAKDCVGHLVDIPLIPITTETAHYYHQQLPSLPARPYVSHKGSYGHVLIIGGNKLANGQGMAGASLLSAKAGFATGVGKITVACHADFHPAVVTTLPDAMTADLYHIDAVADVIKNVDVVAIGMGFGRDEHSRQLFESYLQQILAHGKPCVIDADGLYHLATLGAAWRPQLKAHRNGYFTPHSGEAARLLNTDYATIDKDKIAASKQLQDDYGGNWLLKGANTVVSEHKERHICGLGNPGMATAGMGDVLAGVVAGLLAQHAVLPLTHPLLTACLIHAAAGDSLANAIGEAGLSAEAMPKAVAKVMKSLTPPRQNL